MVKKMLEVVVKYLYPAFTEVKILAFTVYSSLSRVSEHAFSLPLLVTAFPLGTDTLQEPDYKTLLKLAEKTWINPAGERVTHPLEVCSVGSAAPFPSRRGTVTHGESLALMQLHEPHGQRAVSDLAPGGDAAQHLTFQEHSF